MAGMLFDTRISPLLDVILATYAENPKLEQTWEINKCLYRKEFYDSLTQTGNPIQLMVAFLDFLNSPTEENEKILNVLFKKMNQNFDMHSAQSGGFIADEQSPEYVAVRERE